MNNVLVVAAHPDDEILGCGGTLLKHISRGDKVYILYVSEGVTGRYDNKDSKKCSIEISKREEMAKKACRLGKFEIIDFLNLRNLELSSYPHNHLTNIIYKYFKKYKPDIVYTHYEHDLNIDHYQTFFSTFVASRPNNDFFVKKLLSFEIPSSTDWGINSKSFIPNYFVDIKKYKKKKEKLLKFYKYEMRRSPHSRSIKNINSLSIFRGGAVGLNNAEAFFVNKIVD
jgi:LmbE family N-acetylglucosaminyl deacetylase